VDDLIIVELKSVEKIASVHTKQLLTYLRLMKLPVGLLINFGAATLKEGIHRVVNHLPVAASPRLRINRDALSRGDAETRRRGEKRRMGMTKSDDERDNQPLTAPPSISTPPRLRGSAAPRLRVKTFS
jgi:hypothetical protein